MKKLVQYFRIKLGLEKMTIDEEITFAYSIKTTGDPDVTHPSYSDTELQALADKVRDDAALRTTAPAPTLTATEQQHVDKLSRGIISVKNDVETIANKVADGNKAIFDEIITRIGFGSRAKYIRTPRGFEFVASDPGSFHIRAQSEGRGNFTYYFRYGITSAENVLPQTWEETISIPVTEMIVNGIPGGTIIAVQYAVMASPKHNKKSKKPNPPDPNITISKVLTTPTINSKGKIVFTYKKSFLQWSDAIYYMVIGNRNPE